MLSDVIHLLQDPSESSHGVTLRGNEDWTALISEHGREYPISEEGYVILSDGELPAGDDEKMVEARDYLPGQRPLCAVRGGRHTLGRRGRE